MGSIRSDIVLKEMLETGGLYLINSFIHSCVLFLRLFNLTFKHLLAILLELDIQLALIRILCVYACNKPNKIKVKVKGLHQLSSCALLTQA